MKRLNLINFSLLALALTACQDEDLGFTKSEIYQSYIDRKYAEEFAKAFPNVDPNHTWMCTPDTIYHEVEVLGMTRAAGDAPQDVERKKDGAVNSYADMAYSDVSKVLEYMKEGDDNYSNNKASLDFEYKAVEDVEDGCEVYTITPTFWGRKFTDHNAVGIYYIKADGSKKDMGTFWDDYDHRDLWAVYKDGARELVPVTDQQIVDDPNKSNYELSIPLTHTCSKCNGGNKKVSTWIRVNKNNSITTNPDQLSGRVNNMQNCYQVDATQNGQIWNSQFFVVNNDGFKAGDTYRFHIWAKTKDVESAIIGAQLQTGYVGDNDPINLEPRTITNKWTEFVWEETIPSGNKTINSFVLNLSQSNQAVTYYFSDITWEKNPCPYCVGGKSPVDYYKLPQYTLKVPVGTVWGVYLETQKQQTNNKAYIKYYSNSKYNTLTEKTDQTGLKAAATFTYGSTTYVSFEDAPTMCSGGYTGDCNTCGRGHYDHDYNDIVLTISPRPVTKTFRSISYRVMCEDLGGTFDWDFNDVVYDVIYTDGKYEGQNATIDIKLQAVGGTLPIYMKYNNSILTKNGDSNGVSELHVWSTSQTPNSKLYVPVNVVCDQYEVKWTNDEKDKRAITLKTIPLEKQKYTEADNFDLRDYVGNIVIEVEQSSDNTTHEVRFPVAPIENGNNSSIPQCFMTSTGTEWANELQPIYEKYTNFKAWVSDCGSVPQWWKVQVGY